MPFAFSWYIADRVVYGRFSGDVTLDELRAADKTIRNMLENNCEQRLYFLMNLEEIKSSPMNIQQIQKNLKGVRYENFGGILSWGASPVLAVLINSLGRLMKKEICHLQDFESAIERLFQQHPELANSETTPIS